MNILALDSSTEACSAALLREDGEVFARFEIAPRQHTRLLPQMLNQVLSESGVDKSRLTHCAFANGPGAFTGIRIAAAQAQGIGIGLGIPLLPVSTLATLAQVSLDRYAYANTLAALDARMNEIYWAVYQRDEQGCAQLLGDERLSTLDDIRIDADLESGAGHGWLAELRARVELPIDSELLPDARSLLKLAASAAQRNLAVEASAVGINYLRNKVAEKARA
ncbi:MAG: tRNA (adenosine(37)-N6)-threonylcarbamoyltransferase complex dimerization subunit type 1 TsaB [Gammaproteobacteria bacterium]|nr:tRNA (adenosine(37)-N6)-threonylcarbamoyltransferase complex dimerization subunit type 1 TsaB [Gammaproteobacteria bacterium]